MATAKSENEERENRILNAASDGWRVCYIGGNKFEFSNNINEKVNSDMFISKYTRAYLKNDSLYNHIKK